MLGRLRRGDGGIDFGLVGAGDGETGTTEFDICFGDGIADAGGVSEDEYRGVVEFGGEFRTQRGRGRGSCHGGGGWKPLHRKAMGNGGSGC